MNVVIRICLKCKTKAKKDLGFRYLGDSVWSCNECCCKYTEVFDAIDPKLEPEKLIPYN